MSGDRNVKHQDAPVVVPADAEKHIEEHFGQVASDDHGISIARMVAPPGWQEPFQSPEFDEYVLMVRGRKTVEVDGKEYTLSAGQSMRIPRNSRVRYANPFR